DRGRGHGGSDGEAQQEGHGDRAEAHAEAAVDQLGDETGGAGDDGGRQHWGLPTVSSVPPIVHLLSRTRQLPSTCRDGGEVPFGPRGAETARRPAPRGEERPRPDMPEAPSHTRRGLAASGSLSHATRGRVSIP